MTISDICVMMWSFLPKRKRKLKPIMAKDIVYADAIKAFQDLGNACIELMENMSKLRYNGYKNHQSKLRLNTDFE